MPDLFRLSATELVRMLKNKEISSAELTEMYLSRIEKYGISDGLNAVGEINSDALAQAKEIDSSCNRENLPLCGLPILVKDNIDVVGMRTTAGSFALKDNMARYDAPIIKNLRKNGAVILGKTNMTEFANYTARNMPNGYSSLRGQVLNAYDPAKDPGGSSTGSAVAVSAGLCAAAIGTDTAFSIVGCATDNGVTGYKPPHGSLSTQGIIPISHTLDSAGTLTRTLSDAMLIYLGMREAGSPLPQILYEKSEKIRLCVNVFKREDVSQAQLALYDTVINALKKDGGTVAEVAHANAPYMGKIMQYEFKDDLEEYLAQSASKQHTLSEIIGEYEKAPEYMKHGIDTLKKASALQDSETYAAAMREREEVRAQLLEELKNFDACLMTGPTSIMHFAGLPSLALRLGMGADATPRGMILYGADEQRLLRAALTLERYCGAVPFPEKLA